MGPITPPTTVTGENDSLICENQVGSLNSTTSSPAQSGTTGSTTNGGAGGTGTLGPYVPPTLCVGDWEITTTTPTAAQIQAQIIQAGYVAESLNISGAPINIYPLLGVHQQGNGSLLSKGMIIGSQPSPGYPISGINQSGQSWRSIQTGTSVAGACYIGLDFGIKTLSNDTVSPNQTEYEPEAAKWTGVGCIMLTQSNNPGFFATQVRVDIATGDVAPLTPVFTGVGNGTIAGVTVGSDVTQGTVILQQLTPTTFNCYVQLPNSTVMGLGTASVGVPFNSTFINFTINMGSTAFASGDMFTIACNYLWTRAGVFNVIQSPSPQALNLHTVLKCKAVRVVPIMFTGTGNWEVDALDVLDEMPEPVTTTDGSINDIQDLFFNENRDRSYQTTPVMLKCAYTPADSINDLSKFGLSILDQYVFTCSYATMVSLIGRPIVTGDIIEVIPELQWDQNLKPVRKFLEVTDTGWSAAGFGPSYTPFVYRFAAQQALPSQETRDIFGTMDTEKYLMADSIFNNGIGQQIDTTPLTRTEEISKKAANKVPEIGSDDNRSMTQVILPPQVASNPPRNPVGNPTSDTTSLSVPNNLYIEDGLPPNGESYGEGFTLPATSGLQDGVYFRLYYPPETQIAPRLYRFSAVKNRWLFVEQDKRGQYASAKPSVRSIMQSTTRVPLNKKQT